MSKSSRAPPRIEGMVSLKVDNLAYRTSIEDLRRVFSRYGDVGDIYIPRDPYTFESRGFAFVRYCSDREAEVAIRGMDGRKVDGREVRVQRAKYGRPSNRRSIEFCEFKYGRPSNQRRRSVTPRRNGRRSRSYSSDRNRRSPRRYQMSPCRNFSRSSSRERF